MSIEVPQKQCLRCGKSFYQAATPRKYCSYRCQQSSAYERKMDRQDKSWRERECLICGTGFTAGSHTAKYCSDRCRTLKAMQMYDIRQGLEPRETLFCETKRICLFCSKKYWPHNNKQLYCSHTCKVSYHTKKRREAEGKTPKVPCAICTKKIIKKNPHHRYCSVGCAEEARRRRQRKQREVHCARCNKLFFTSGMGKNNQRFCGLECRKIVDQERMVRFSSAKESKKEELFRQGIKAMVLPIASGADAVAMLPQNCDVNEVTEPIGPSEFADEIQKFLAKGGKIKRLVFKETGSAGLARREGNGFGVDDNEYPMPSELGHY
jgi:predicted nucleic acid-binding Zn ribbon protein